MIHILDLQFQVSESIAAFIYETSEGPVLVECGPHSTWSNLVFGIEEAGFKVEDIKHLFLTHIHFDHAGAAWALAEKGATVYVHPVGYPHMLNPTKLYDSAKRIYGDMMETLWGIMKEIPENQLISVEDGQEITVGDTTFKALFTPGHATHHIAWQVGKDIFAGDVAGARIGEGGPVVPPCPPPDINIEHWQASIKLLKSLEPETFYITHFGKVTDPIPHLNDLEKRLVKYANWMKPHYEAGKKPPEVVPDFQAYVTQEMRDIGLTDEQIGIYETANPSYMSVAGLIRYWRKKLSPR
ncbi:MAG: MBL fold metallo-hydrolase [Bacteroidota bacterium]